MQELSEKIGEMLTTCLENGMTAPLTLVGIGCNGSVLVVRYVWSESHDGFDAVPLAEHFEDRGFQVPINIMIVDLQAEAARILIERGGIKYLHWIGAPGRRGDSEGGTRDT